MRVKTEKGWTDVRFEDFVAAEPKVAKVRSGYRQACIDKPGEREVEEHQDKVIAWCNSHFGENRFNRDWDSIAGALQGSAATKAFETWLSEQPPIYRKFYYSSLVVAACIMGADE